MRIEDLIDTLFKDVAAPTPNANTPGELVRASLSGSMPGLLPPRRPAPMPTGAPVLPVSRAPMPPPMAAGGPPPTPMAAPAPAPASPATFSPNPLATLARGYKSGGLIGALGNMFEEPALLQREAAEKVKATAEETARQNQTAQFLISKRGLSPEEAAAVVRDPEVLRKYLAPPPVVDPLDRTKRELEIEKLRKEVAGDTVATKRLAELERLGIDPNSAEGMIYQANGKLPESAAKEIIGRQQKGKAGPQVARGLENLNKMADTYDEVSLESAIGPWQGADPDQTGLLSAPVANIARGLGEAWNVIRGGKDNLSEIRSNIRGTTEALAAAIKPLIRGPGEGVWTDADQARLVSIVGDLAQASTKEEFKRRLNAVRDRITSNFNIDVPFDANAAPTTADDGLSGLSTDEIRRRLRGGS